MKTVHMQAPAMTWVARPVAMAALLCTSGLMLAGCGHEPKMAQMPFKVAPHYQVGHAPGVDVAAASIVRARELEREGRLEVASAWWAQAVKAAPERADAHQGLGVCLARLGRLDESVAALAQAHALAPHDAQILNNLGHALKLSGRLDEARVAFEQALALDPQHEKARYNLAQLVSPHWSLTVTAKAENGKSDKSAETAEKATATQAAATLPSRPVDVVPLPRPAQAEAVQLAVQTTPNVQPLTLVQAPSVPLSLKVDLAMASASAPVARSEPVPPQGAGMEAGAVPMGPMAPTPAHSPAQVNLVHLAQVKVEVFNGNGMSGAAKGLKTLLIQQGVQADRVANMPSFDTPTTRVVYKPGQMVAARQLARLLPVSSELVEASPDAGKQMRAELRVVLGHNLSPHMAACLIKGQGACDPTAEAMRMASANGPALR